VASFCSNSQCTLETLRTRAYSLEEVLRLCHHDCDTQLPLQVYFAPDNTQPVSSTTSWSQLPTTPGKLKIQAQGKGEVKSTELGLQLPSDFSCSCFVRISTTHPLTLAFLPRLS